MDEEILGLELKWWALIALGGAAVWFYFKRQNQSAQDNANAPTSLSVNESQPALNAAQQYEASWPYNQLALPFNYDVNGISVNNATDPQNPAFVGYNSTMVTSG